MPAAPLVVQKFGGSSLADADRIRRVARRIARERAAGSDLVVIVSAMGDATDELLGLAAAITDTPDERELDMLLATGEHQSATLVSMALHALGVAAISLSGPQAGITTDGRYGRARIASIEPARIRAELEQGKVVIVAGFQGRAAGAGVGTPGADTPAATDDITTLGRGGSDTTAVALAARLGADRCQIFTDVRGIYTADPRLVPDARQLKIVGYEEMLELAHQGAQVMQTRAVELGWVNGDMIVQNVGHGGETDMSFTVPQAELGKTKKALEGVVRDLGARELTTDASVAKVSIVGAGLHNAPGYAARMFGTLADAGVNIEMISTSEVRITCVIGEASLSTALDALHGAFELEKPDPVDAEAALPRAG